MSETVMKPQWGEDPTSIQPPAIGKKPMADFLPKQHHNVLMRMLYRLLAVFFILPIGIACAQTITISPSGYIPVGLSSKTQFTATVTQLTDKDVTWSAGGAVGGNATSGTISTSGLYTAPANVPSQNPVAIKATSKVDTALSTTVYVTILNPGPKLTAVSPNPLPQGTFTVTLTGTGFQQGAVAVDTYNGNGVQLSTVSVTSTTIVATGYQPTAPNASFTVTNPGSSPSNAIVVPVTNGSTTYMLTVNSGSGAGSYSAGTTVTIVANTPPQGQTFVNWTGATVANPTSATTTLVMPAAATTVTANYSGSTKYTLTVNSGTGSGSYASGATVSITANAPPQGQSFLNWTGATVANPNSATTTLVMPSAATTVTANFSSNSGGQIPFPVTTHPRLWVTPNDVTRLRTWAVNSNPVYAKGMAPLLQTAVNVYTMQFFPNGVQNPNYPDPGDTQGYTGYLTEQYAAILAFNSLIDPSASNRIIYAKYARNMLMVAMNQAALGVLSGAPFRDPMFPTYNRANGTGEQWPLIVDWLYSAKDAGNNPILTATDKATIRKVFMIWANECLNASTAGGDHPVPIGTTNSLTLLPNNQPYRMASNNYYLGHARLLTMMALSIDPTDDPAVNSSLPLSTLGNSLRSYIPNATGAWLYQEYAMMGDAANVASDLSVPGNGAGFGLAAGGLPPEGMLYGHSFGFILGQLLALQTAGFNNPAYSGKQINLINAPVWDRYVKGYLSSITPTAMVPPSETYLGAVFGLASYGDLLRLYVTPDVMQPFSLLSLLEHEQGLTTHDNIDRWAAVNIVPGGAANLMNNITDPFSWSTSQSILYFMLLDPSAATATDPRSTFSTTFVDPGASRIVAHSDWSPTNTIFDYRASWESINHQDGDGGQFEFFRKGEWLTKEMSNYDNNGVGMTTFYHNSLALKNWCPNGTPNLNWWEVGEWANGSNFMLAMNNGDPKSVNSSGTGYVYASSDLTNLYNRPDVWDSSNASMDIIQATRQIAWLNNDYIVIYDRATSIHPGLFKRFNMSLVNNPVISGHVAKETMADGQNLFVQTLLPASASITAANVAGNLSPIAELEPTRYVMTVQDPSNPTDTRFLHVLQGADAGTQMVQANYVTSASGTPCDGAQFGTTAIFFPVNAGVTFATTTFNVPTSVTTFIVTGLKAGTTYKVSAVTTGQTKTVTVTTNTAGSPADAAGLLKTGI